MKMSIDAAAIPLALRERDQWVVWRYETRQGKRTKVPLDAKTGQHASVSEPATWTTFDKALAVYEASETLSGISYVFCADDPFCGIDVDDCLDEEGHLLWGSDLLELFPTYCEVSPSGRGLKLIMRGKKPESARCKANWFDAGTIEVYDQKRLFAITGQLFDGCPAEVLDCQENLDALCTQFWGQPAPKPASLSAPTPPSTPTPARLTQTIRPALEACLNAMLKLNMVDHRDGSLRLYTACCRAVEHDLSDLDAVQCIREYERQRPFPHAWSDAEIVKRLRDAERQCVRGSAQSAILNAFPPTFEQMRHEYSALRPAVIQGLLRRGESMNIIASPKAGKSWLAGDLAITLASGRDWLGIYPTSPGKVLLIDNELHRETVTDRIAKVSAARGVPFTEFENRLHIECLRGRLVDIDAMGDYFCRFPPGQFQVVILDSLYRMLPAGIDENDNAAMCQVYNSIDRYADWLGASFALVHHSSKGNQTGKSVTDVGSGAGSISRAADTHLILRPHQEPNCAVVEAAVRSWPPIEPRVLRWSFPVWIPDDNLDPSLLRMEPSRSRSKADTEDKEPKKAEPRWTPERFAEVFLSPTVQTKEDIILTAEEEADLSERRVIMLLKTGVSRGLIHHWRNGKITMGYANTPMPALVSKSDHVRQWLQSDPSLSGHEIEERTGASRTLVNRIRKELETPATTPLQPLKPPATHVAECCSLGA